MTEQHYRMTLSDAIAQYKAELITATSLVYYYIRIKRAAGWKIALCEKTVTEELGIKKSTFYKAIAKLLEKGLIQTEKSKVIITVLDLSPQSIDPSPQSIDLSLQTVENESLESLPQACCSDCPNLLIDSYQIFNNSLSDNERESFLNFAKKKAAQLPNPPQLPQRWIEKNFDELRLLWYKSTGQTTPSQNHKWETDPRTADWLAIIEETANPLEFATDKEKQDFIRWCNETKQFSWLKGES
ncbi:hypothetical protein [Nostoc sphaeroides]|uniref:Helix-turn-helix domain-containing protein n=1 Tax=Nostoc sphaeroides CCNUC1 TaxID=2653204 RepID=A0A5P8WDK1_9NOSO|nr:hypothetical protein [Nostoc sphaeroides]QFS50622.1 hypothetical protein GXM_08116 [Nostoc sphaeroides CCNUC1]